MSRYTILCVDDEENILSALERVFLDEEDYEVITANCGEEGLKILREKSVELILSDQRMPGMSGIEFLKESKKINPDIIRIVLSGYADFNSILAAINEGEIYRFIPKPWDDNELLLNVKDSLEKYELVQENKKLQEEIRRQNEELKVLNFRLEEKVKQRTQELLLRNQILLLSQEMLHHVSIPIIGISSEESIVFINKQAQELYENHKTSVIGKDIQEVFPEDIMSMIKKVFQDQQIQILENVTYDHHRLTIKCLPLLGQFAGKGVILETAVME